MPRKTSKDTKMSDSIRINEVGPDDHLTVHVSDVIPEETIEEIRHVSGEIENEHPPLIPESEVAVSHEEVSTPPAEPPIVEDSEVDSKEELLNDVDEFDDASEDIPVASYRVEDEDSEKQGCCRMPHNDESRLRVHCEDFLESLKSDKKRRVLISIGASLLATGVAVGVGHRYRTRVNRHRVVLTLPTVSVKKVHRLKARGVKRGLERTMKRAEPSLMAEGKHLKREILRTAKRVKRDMERRT